MKCNYKRPKLSKEEQQDFASYKTTLPLIDRIQIAQRNRESEFDWYDVNENVVEVEE